MGKHYQKEAHHKKHGMLYVVGGSALTLGGIASVPFAPFVGVPAIVFGTGLIGIGSAEYCLKNKDIQKRKKHCKKEKDHKCNQCDEELAQVPCLFPFSFFVFALFLFLLRFIGGLVHHSTSC
jgi:hypothetical protein